MPYIGVSPQFGVRRKHTYTATAGQTSFSGAGSEGATLSYKDSNFVDVYQNGVKLGDADYTSTSGTAIVLAQGASVNDLVEIIVFDAFSISDTVSKADGGTFDGNVTMGGTLGVTGASTLTGALSAKGGAVFNEDSADVDFRVESNGNTHGIFLDAGAGLVGIGNSNPDGHYNLADDLVIGNGSGGRGLTIYSGNDSSGYIGFNDAEQDSMTAYIQYGHNDNTMTLASSAGASLKIDSIGAVTKPNQPAFMAKLSSNQTNINNNSAHQDIQFANEIFDQNADFNTSNYTFTAPVTGRYQLNVQVYLEQVDTAMDFFYVTLLCSNNSAFFILDPNFSADLSYYHVGGSVLMDMDAGDTAKLTYVQAAGTAQTDVNTNSYFSGFLAC